MQTKNEKVPEEWERKPIGCYSEEHWKECRRNGRVDSNGRCSHPSDDVNSEDGIPICPHKPNAISIKNYNQRKEK